MILRRISEHMKDQNWFAVGIELVILVLGVFIGIQVANWNEARKDRADEAIVLRSLHDEVVTVQKLSARILATRHVQLTDALTALTQSRESMDFVFDYSRAIAIDLSKTHSDVFKLIPRVVPVQNAPGQTERDYGAECDFEKLKTNQAALNGLVSNLEYFDAFARDGLIPWTERLGAVHARLDELLALSHTAPEKQ